jgi:hypothetical protein
MQFRWPRPKLRIRYPALLSLLALACTPPRSQPERRLCEPLGVLGPAALSNAYAEGSSALVLAGDAVFACPCGAPRQVKSAAEDRTVKGAEEERGVKGASEERGVKGDEEARAVKGAEEERGVKGASEERTVKGDEEARAVKGAEEGRSVKGASEEKIVQVRSLKGAEEERSVKGASETVTCAWTPECGGFSVEGTEVTHRYDGRTLVPTESSCVRDR